MNALRTRMPRALRRSLRWIVAIAAIVLVGRSVQWRDSVELIGGQTRHGWIQAAPGGVRLTDGAGSRQWLPESHIARDSDGTPRIHLGLLSSARQSRVSALVAAIVLFSLTPILQALRLSVLLRSERIPLPSSDSVRLAFAGNFLNFAAPFGSTAGDAYKAIALAHRVERSAEAATVVLLDRAVGLGTLLASVALVCLLSGDARLAAVRPFVLLFTLILAVGVAAYLLAGPALLAQWTRRSRRRDVIERVDGLLRRRLLRPGALALAVLVTFGIQLLAAGAFVMVCAALHMHTTTDGFATIYAYFSAGELIRALPGPPQGLGTMELAYRYFFADCGSASQILSAAVLIRMVNLLCSLPGVLWIGGVLPSASVQPRPAPASA